MTKVCLAIEGYTINKKDFFSAVHIVSSSTIKISKKTIIHIKDVSKELSGTISAKEMGKFISSILVLDNPIAGIRLLHNSGVLKYFIPEVSRCERVSQNPKYHINNVFDHCIKVCSCTDNYLPLRWAGLLHDIGKFQAYKKTSTGVSFHKHEVYSTIMTKEIMLRLGIPKKIAKEVVFLVRMHMYYYSDKWNDKTVRRFIKKLKLNKESCETLSDIPIFRLRKADRKSRGLNPSTPKQIDFEKRICKTLETI
jgi:poly(A) polymerase/tRNA nucleotidyltransferase (CCA-adding enzyme)